MAQGDMFLKVEGTVMGPIKGESQDKVHQNEIDVLSWSWGMEGNRILGSMITTSKSTIQELKLTKHVDSASTALMSALRNNELIKTAVLTVRKAGGKEPVEYVKITLAKARVTSLTVHSGDESDPAVLIEELSFAFQKITVDYTPQGAEGSGGGGMTFEADAFAQS
jgi:type VI secretion system secreted protein Hcp